MSARKPIAVPVAQPSSGRPIAVRTSPRAQPRGDVFYLIMAVIIALVVAIGFGRNLDANLLHPPSPRPLILHVHVAIMTAWILLFLAQTALVRARKVLWHRRLGLCGLAVGALLPVVGIATAIVTTRAVIAEDPSAGVGGMAFFAISCFDMLAFALTFWLAIVWRRHPEFHKRLMLIATCGLLSAAFARFPSWVMPGRAWYAAVDLLILAGVARDLIVARRVHAVYRYGLPILILGQSAAMWLYATRAPAWIAMVRPFFS